jgi:hypothetical protein
MNTETTKETFKISNNSLWIGGGILVTLGLLITGIVIYSKKKKILGGKSGSSKSSSSGGSGFCKYGDNYPLKYGSCGKKVIVLQKQLVSKGIDIGGYGVDGKYGKDTEKAVKKAIGRSTVELADIKNLKTIKIVA